VIFCIGSYGGGSPSCVLALNWESGHEVWKTPTEGLTNSSPIAITAGGKRQIIVWTQKSVMSLSPTTGEAYWQEATNTLAQNAVATPVIEQNLLLISGLMLKLDADKPTASVLWPQTKTSSHRVLSHTSTPALLDSHVFSAKMSGGFVCLEARTGKEIWQTDQVAARQNEASAHVTPQGNAVFIFTDTGDLLRARLTPAGYEEISRTRLIEPTYPYGGRKVAWPPPAYANRCVFARNDQELICVSLAATP
jgi:outer membrane protein assembly factor BamB